MLLFIFLLAIKLHKLNIIIIDKIINSIKSNIFLFSDSIQNTDIRNKTNDVYNNFIRCLIFLYKNLKIA